MPNFNHISSNNQKHLSKINIYIIYFLILFNLVSKSITSISIDNYLYDIIIFNHTKFNAGKFATNKKGELFIEYYSEGDKDLSASRLFYGRTKDGRELFFNQTSSTQEINIGLDETVDISEYYNLFDIYDSENLFVSIMNENNKENQYLFSINSYDWSVELNKFTNNINIGHYLWNFNDFFNLNEEKYIFPYETSLIEIKSDSSYIIGFIPRIYISENMKDLSFIKKFKFKSFNENAYEEIRAIKYNNYINKRILSVFSMDEKYLVVISVEEIEIDGNNDNYDEPDLRRRILQSFFKFSLNFYLNDLEAFEFGDNNKLEINNFYYYYLEDLFFKSIYIKKGFTVFTWILPDYFDDLLIIGLYKLNYLSGGHRIEEINDIIINNNYIDEILSDFVKINDIRLVFICTNCYLSHPTIERRRNLQIIENQLNILIIDIQPDFTGFGQYKILQGIIEEYIPTKQISVFYYNDFLLFTSTAILAEEYYNFEDEINYLSIFMIFGYPNGTDIIINITDFLYFEEEGSKPGDDFLYKFLEENYLYIENNIFGYVFDKRINLVSIPDELIINEMYGRNWNFEGYQLQNNSELLSSEKYRIKQNTSLIKTSKYYYIDYQFIVRENKDEKRRLSEEEPKYYYGRVNRLKFKLCHEYCETCYELGLYDDIQNCTSCLPEYQYDYLTYYYSYDYYEENAINCVPENHYFDIYSNTIILCNETNSNYYINTTDNKKICFNISNSCPYKYPDYNWNSRECLYCDYAHYSNGECTERQFITRSCSRCNFDCYMMEFCNFDDFDETNKDFYEEIKKGGFISNFNSEDDDLKLSIGNGYSFQITTVEKELNSLKENTRSDFSIIDLKECADILKSRYELDPDEDLVILKYENNNQVSNGNAKSIQYEVYAPNSNTKLDLSVCDDTNIIIYVPIELSEETQKLYDNLREQGYNLFDKNDKFYKKFCTPYKSLDGTDVILSDRFNEIYEPNKLECQKNCEYSDYLPDSKYLKCECHITNEEKIDTKEPEKITAKSVSNSFYNILKYSNYKVLYCYNLVFRKVTIKENVGSILSNIYFIGYLIAFGILCYTKANYLKKEIDKLLKDENNDNQNNSEINKDNISIFNKNNNDKERNKDIINIKEEKKDEMNEEKTEKINVDNNKENKNSKIKNESINIINNNRRKSDIGYKGNNNFSNNIKSNEKMGIFKKNSYKIKDISKLKESFSESKILGSKDQINNQLPIFDQISIKEMSKNPSEKSIDKKSDNDSKKENEDLTDYELNDLEYDEALELDNRNFFKTYWYLLKREHIILFTFFNWNDFNLFAIKLSKLFLSVCSDMAFNVFFFADESMHKIYKSGGKYDFIDQLAQMVYSTIISQLLQIYINYLTMTDIDYYKLKELKNDNNLNSKKALSVIKCIKIKIIAYFFRHF